MILDADLQDGREVPLPDTSLMLLHLPTRCALHFADDVERLQVVLRDDRNISVTRDSKTIELHNASIMTHTDVCAAIWTAYDLPTTPFWAACPPTHPEFPSVQRHVDHFRHPGLYTRIGQAAKRPRRTYEVID